MARYAAFLRGMNIGGRRIKNDELKASLERIGFDEVAIFRASGNAIFEVGGRRGPKKLTAQVEDGLGDALGYEVPVFLRTAAEVRAIAAHAPFDAQHVEASAGKVQVSLLLEEPKAAAGKRVLALSTDRDRLAIHGRELYWLPSGGISESDLDLQAIGSALGLSTMRTKGTIEQIAAKHFS
jgi:uncharacterized protein (DUF1697 family)